MLNLSLAEKAGLFSRWRALLGGELADDGDSGSADISIVVFLL